MGLFSRRSARDPRSTSAHHRRGAALLLVLAGLVACDEPSPETWTWDLPEGVPEPRVPADNPMSAAKVELGRFLFYDVRLSGNETQSCASCHRQELAFTDALAVSEGSTGAHTPRGSMSLANVAYLPVLTWANPALSSLEDQIIVPMFAEDPVELGLAGRDAEMLDRLRADERYVRMFAAAYPREADPFTLANVVRAITTFERSLLSFDSPYDRWAYGGDETAMSEPALRGMDLFFSERFECFHCHGGFAFSDAVQHDGSVLPEIQFHNTGLYDVDGRGAYPEPNTGLYATTGDRRDMGRFRAPTLRNIELTAPYMHDGSIATLEGVLDHYQAGGTLTESGPHAGDGRSSPLKSIFVHGFDATAEERADLLAFLRSLTDRTFVEDPRHSDPFASDRTEDVR